MNESIRLVFKIIAAKTKGPWTAKHEYGCEPTHDLVYEYPNARRVVGPAILPNVVMTTADAEFVALMGSCAEQIWNVIEAAQICETHAKYSSLGSPQYCMDARHFLILSERLALLKDTVIKHLEENL